MTYCEHCRKKTRTVECGEVLALGYVCDDLICADCGEEKE